MDRYLQGRLKNWANQQQPAPELRARLLLLAASSADSCLEPNIYDDQARQAASNEPGGQPITWRMQNSEWMLMFQASMPALRMV